ncbi:hypothetical protein ACFPMF_11235 [Larkinella bovis]|uniref:DNA-binding protein n=1 Tax=Larkinella bovis TaxID=683041 RepID=A0ABW0I9B7_9BACT
MDAIAVLPAEKVQQMIDRHEAAARELVEAKRQLAASQNEQYVPLEWIEQYLDIGKVTAKEIVRQADKWLRLQKKELRVFAHGERIKRYRRSDIERYIEAHEISYRQMKSAS